LTAAALMALAGCEGSYGARQPDPLVGIHAPPLPSTNGAAPVQSASSGVPPLPASHTPTSLGALASGATPTPESPRTLRMDTPPVPVVPVSSPAGETARGVAPNTAVLGEPQPAAPQSTSSSLMPIPIQNAGVQQTAASTPVPPGEGMSFEQAQQFLKQRGVVWQRLETWGDQGQWKFRCSIPVPNKPINHTYETIPPLPYDPLTAIRAVISQIERGAP